LRVRLIRRAKAGRRGSSPKNDALRPLSEEGTAQARGLVEQLDGQRIERIVSSPYRRCVETVEPLAKRRGLEIELDDRLAEGASIAKALRVLRSVGDSEAVICTHSDVIGKLLRELSPRVKARGERLRRRKASMWVLEGDLDGKLKGQYLPPSSRYDEEPRRIAVLDLGSTSFHLLVGDVGSDGSIERVLRERDMLRLGALVSEHAHIPLADCDRAIESVLRLRDVAEAAECEELLAIATSAFREARNGNLLARVLGRVLGTRVRILSGEEEARAIFSAYRRRMDLGPKPELGIDLGGGSLELAVGNASGVDWETTLPLGAVRLHREFVDDAPGLPQAAATKLRKHVERELAPLRSEIEAERPERCIGTGGTVRSLARVVLARDSQAEDPSLLGTELKASALAKLAKKLQRTEHEEWLAIPGVSPRRADILPAGAIIIATVLEVFGFAKLKVCDWGLREGIMLDAVRDPKRAG
jgi:exopolyphosphatase/guanosine-5'-triphosphate,3'-diphosphate pyrophosphatase